MIPDCSKISRSNACAEGWRAPPTSSCSTRSVARRVPDHQIDGPFAPFQGIRLLRASDLQLEWLIYMAAFGASDGLPLTSATSAIAVIPVLALIQLDSLLGLLE